jgi:hypothetical protein
MHRRPLVLALLLFVALGVGSSVATAGSGKNASAKMCQKNGWQQLQTSTGGTFANQSDCVSYGAGGGTLFGPSVTATDLGCVAIDGVLYDEWALYATGFTPNTLLFINGNNAIRWVFDGSGSFTELFVADGPGFTVSADFVDGNGVHASVTFGPMIDCST